MRNYTPPPVPDSIWQKPSHFIAFGFGSGAIPFAPGTFGTLVAVPLYLLMQSLSHGLYLFLLLLIIIGSSWLCDKVSNEIGVEDHQGMCLDEIVGFLVTMYAAPHGIKWIILGFIFFRIYDIWKPWPIQFIDEKVKNGFGMILDDVLAGIYALITIHILSWLI